MSEEKISDERLKELADFDMPCIGGRGTYKHEASRIAAETLALRAENERLKSALDSLITDIAMTEQEGPAMNTTEILNRLEAIKKG